MILNQYCHASGQAINLNKSEIFFSSNCPPELRNNMANTLRVVVMEKSGKYLDFTLDWGDTKKEMFPWVLACVNTKLEGWKENLISKAGKEILIKIVIQPLPQYATSIFKILVSICKSVEQKVANFWWKNSDSKAGIHWKKWDVLK